LLETLTRIERAAAQLRRALANDEKEEGPPAGRLPDEIGGLVGADRCDP
jgi:hypothetical protein